MDNVKDIKLIAFDVDGVLTNGQIVYTSSGEEVKCFHARDGLGIVAAHLAGLKLAIITGRESQMVRDRARELKVDYLYEKCKDKVSALKEISENSHIDYRQIAYMGDDLNDLAVAKLVGLPMTPANGCMEMKEVAGFISSYNGGHGAVREAVEYILKEKGLWDQVVQRYESGIHVTGQ